MIGGAFRPRRGHPGPSLIDLSDAGAVNILAATRPGARLPGSGGGSRRSLRAGRRVGRARNAELSCRRRRHRGARTPEITATRWGPDRWQRAGGDLAPARPPPPVRTCRKRRRRNRRNRVGARCDPLRRPPPGRPRPGLLSRSASSSVQESTPTTPGQALRNAGLCADNLRSEHQWPRLWRVVVGPAETSADRRRDAEQGPRSASGMPSFVARVTPETQDGHARCPCLF